MVDSISPQLSPSQRLRKLRSSFSLSSLNVRKISSLVVDDIGDMINSQSNRQTLKLAVIAFIMVCNWSLKSIAYGQGKLNEEVLPMSVYMLVGYGSNIILGLVWWIIETKPSRFSEWHVWWRCTDMRSCKDYITVGVLNFLAELLYFLSVKYLPVGLVEVISSRSPPS